MPTLPTVALMLIFSLIAIGLADAKSKKSSLCSEYDIVSQSMVPCGTSPKKAKPTGVKKSTNYCTEYDIVSQSYVPCGTASRKAPKTGRVQKSTDYCTKYDIVSQSYERCK